LEKLGEGAFGMVVAAHDKQTDKKVAVKKIKLGKKHNGVPGSALREIAILRSLSHPNIVRYNSIKSEWKTYFTTSRLPSSALFLSIIRQTYMSSSRKRGPVSVYGKSR
jgi:serine/threonine protein kinase